MSVNIKGLCSNNNNNILPEQSIHMERLAGNGSAPLHRRAVIRSNWNDSPACLPCLARPLNRLNESTYFRPRLPFFAPEPIINEITFQLCNRCVQRSGEKRKELCIWQGSGWENHLIEYFYPNKNFEFIKSLFNWNLFNLLRRPPGIQYGLGRKGRMTDLANSFHSPGISVMHGWELSYEAKCLSQYILEGQKAPVPHPQYCWTWSRKRKLCTLNALNQVWCDDNLRNFIIIHLFWKRGDLL